MTKKKTSIPVSTQENAPSTIRHKPVLVQEVLTYLDPQPKKWYLDVTFGSGGHTRAILEKDPTCHVIALDWDKKVLEQYGQELQVIYGDRISFVWGNFGQLYAIAKREGIANLDGILADFGTSFMQIHERPGFSIYRDTSLDMRMSSAHQVVTAQDVLAKATAEKLAQIFWQLGEERHSKAIAQAIVQARAHKPITTTKQLAEIVEHAAPLSGRRRTIHPATRVFQALRIYVNHELENITAFMHAATRLLAPDGKLVCISFHSLEDRLVKHFFREQEKQGILTVQTPHAIIASEDEKRENPSSRSAKLRAASKNASQDKGE